MERLTSVADVEEILRQIRDLNLLVDAEKKKLDESVAYFKLCIDNAKKNFDTDTRDNVVQVEILKNLLEQFYRDNPPTGKRKSLKFGGGSFGYNKAQTKFFLNGEQLDADNPKLLAYVKANRPEFLKVKEYVDWAAFKAKLNADDPDNVFLEDTGEIFEDIRAKKIFAVKVNE